MVFCLIERQKLDNKIPLINFKNLRFRYQYKVIINFYDYNTYCNLNKIFVYDCNTSNLDMLYYILKDIIKYDIIDEVWCYIKNENSFRLYDETKKSYYKIPFNKYPNIRYYKNETMKTFINKFISFYDKHIVNVWLEHYFYDEDYDENYVYYNILNYNKLIESFLNINPYIINKNLISIPETIIKTSLIIPKEKINQKKQLKFRLKEQQKRFIKEYTLKKQKRKIYYN